MAIIYKEDWSVSLQARLSEEVKWKDFMKVDISNKRTLHNPYRADATLLTLVPYTAYVPAQVALTDESVTIDVPRVIPEIIDRADLAQSGYLSQMDLADHQGDMINEGIETYIYSQHAQWTDFDNASIGGAAGNITVSASNIDDIIRGVKREINEAKGSKLAGRNGIFIVWRPADFEILEAFMQANGFQLADKSLENGIENGVKFMGVTHYQSNLLTAGHLFGGVKKVAHLGLLQSTYGQIMVDDKDPGLISGVSVVSRVDMKVKAWFKTKPVLFDILVA